MRVARGVARECVRQRAIAVVLTGSVARGDMHAHSDVDIIAIVRASIDDTESLHRGGRLVTVAWTTAASVRAAFHSPRRAGTDVPGWREAVILHDPMGVAGRLQRHARAWTWDDINAACNEWVADQVTGWAEEVHKLCGFLDTQQTLPAAVQRNVLAANMAGVMAVHERVLYGTENALWSMMSERLGARWMRAQLGALHIDGSGERASYGCALRLYVMAAERAAATLDVEQRAVVEHACKIARRTAARLR